MEPTFSDFAARLREFIGHAPRGTSAVPDKEFNELAQKLFRLQHRHNSAYRRLCDARGIRPDRIEHWTNIPSVHTSAFKELDLTSLAPADRTTTFMSSGTTAQMRSRHFHDSESLALYETSLLSWFEPHLLPERATPSDESALGPSDDLPMLILTPPPASAPGSSLVHMMETVRRAFGSRDSQFVGRVDAQGCWTVDIETALFAIRKSMCGNRPIALLGTAFNFVHLLDHFAANNMRYRLAQGSRVMETGGYKGQSREVPKGELHALITRHLGIAPEHIITEYGMSELSSQAYDGVSGIAGERWFRFPPWARSQVISPETGLEVAEGETGLLRLFDLANVRSAMAIQTDDLAIRRGDAFELMGRATQAEARGCSLMSPAMEMRAPG
jgi:hypothetical protein